MRKDLICPALLLALASCGGSPSQPADHTDAKVADIPAPAGVVDTSMADAGHWQCGDLLVDTSIKQDALRLMLSGRTLTLIRTESQADTRYADPAGNAFLRQEDGAELFLSDGSRRNCTPSKRASPWTDAASRNIAFRAVGSEPGWTVEIGEGGAPSLNAVLDYGQRKIEIAQMRPAQLGYRGETSDGTPVALEIQRAPCQSASGETFQADATLTVGDASFRGCGAFLSE